MNYRLPVIKGIIARRVLVNFRVKPEFIQPLLPAPFRPKLVHGWAMAGLCLIRLEAVRPKGLPAALGLASENVAHRIAVEWDDAGQVREGVFIPRRDTDSRFNALVGGRLFPGLHHHAAFWTAQSPHRFKVELRSDDGAVFVRVAARLSDRLPVHSIFNDLPHAPDFFRCGSCGWSPAHRPGVFEGLKLQTTDWHLEPLVVERVESSWFDDAGRFPKGSVEFDSAFLMRDIDHEWHGLPPLRIQNQEAA